MRQAVTTLVCFFGMSVAIGGNSPEAGNSDLNRCARNVVPTHTPKPPYPSDAIENRQEGTVVLRVRIDDMGRPIGASIAKSSGWPLLDASAVGISRSWRFNPRACMLLGSGKQMDVAVPVSFALPERRAPIQSGPAQPELSWGALR